MKPWTTTTRIKLNARPEQSGKKRNEDNMCNLATVLDGALYRSSRPGYPDKSVNESTVAEWVAHAKGFGIKTILCLLDEVQLAFYSSIKGGPLGYYARSAFHVTHRPVKDHLQPPVPQSILDQAGNDFLMADKPVLVHCSAGWDRTGAVVRHILGQ